MLWEPVRSDRKQSEAETPVLILNMGSSSMFKLTVKLCERSRKNCFNHVFHFFVLSPLPLCLKNAV